MIKAMGAQMKLIKEERRFEACGKSPAIGVPISTQLALAVHYFGMECHTP